MTATVLFVGGPRHGELLTVPDIGLLLTPPNPRAAHRQYAPQPLTLLGHDAWVMAADGKTVEDHMPYLASVLLSPTAKRMVRR